MEYGQCATRGELVCYSRAVSAKVRGAVETPVGPLDNPGQRVLAVRAIGLGAKAVDGRQGAAGRDLEDLPAAAVTGTV